MATRKAPTGAKHARCVHHEAYPSAPAGWLCFSDETAPTDETIIERMEWADELEAARVAHRAAWLALSATADGMLVHYAYEADGRRAFDSRGTGVSTGTIVYADTGTVVPTTATLVPVVIRYRPGTSPMAETREAVAA